MKKYTVALSFIIILVCVFHNLISAQTNQSVDDRKWSRITKVENINNSDKLNYKYFTPSQEIQRYILNQTEAVVLPNYRVLPTTNTTQSELSIDIHPNNPNILFAGSNGTTWPVTEVYGTGVYWSANAGLSWTGFDNPAPYFGTGNSGDPAAVIGTNGYFYMGYINNSGGQGISRSTNNGANWTSYTVTPLPGAGGLADKNHLMVDKKVGSPFENRLYAAWTDFGGVNEDDICLKYSTNFGQTWSSINNISSTLNSFNQGVNIQTGPNGEVYVTWAIYAGTDNLEDGIGFTKSMDGGATWSLPIYAYQAANFGIRGYLKSTQIRVASFPSMTVDRSGGSRNGYIYITWPQRGVSPAGSDPDVVMIRSTNGGTTWSTPVRVNYDALSNGKDQYYPWCAVDQSNGQLNIVFYDNRLTTSDSTGVWMASSNDGGLTFDNFNVSDANFKPKPISGLAGGYQGDYIGITAGNSKAYPFWADDRTGNYQAWITQVSFGPPCPVGSPSNPNPGNGTNNISVYLPQISWTNGAGANQCEVWFGTSGNMTMVYDGSLVSSWTISAPLEYSTNYNWQIVEKNDTCSTYGPVWAFVTELSPGIAFIENFNNLNCWTTEGPLGTTNWTIQNSTTAGGASPELRLSWNPDFNGLSKLKSCAIPVLSNRNYTINLKHMLDFFATTAPTLGMGVSYDNGTTYTSIWSFTPTSNVGPEIIQASFLTPPGATNLNLILYCNGNSYNIDYWYLDDIILNDDDYSVAIDPTNVLATPINGSQIEISFTPNVNNNNVLVLWNLTGTFTTPTGPPSDIGQPFAGGTLLYNGTTSPFNHSGLDPLTTYYYKLFSYNGSNYSPGVTASATTLSFFDFGVNLLVYDNCSNSIPLIFGTALGATDCFDPGLDESAPPPPPLGAFDARFISCAESWFTDIRGTNPDGEKIWDVYYLPESGCEPVSLSWNPEQLPTNGYFHLVDPFSGTLVNVNMRTTNNYTDMLGLGHLQIKFNYQICSNYNLAAGWNILSLPLEVSNNNYLTLFPNAVPGTLFEYSETYFSSETIEPFLGYWLKFPSAQNNQVCGLDRTESILSINAGWNLIGGPNCNVPIESVIDPGGIIIPGTLYGYSESYISATSIDATKAYWVKANASGSINISCEALLAKNSNELIISSETLDNFSMIEIDDVDKNSQTLYFNGSLNDDINIESFSLPPVPPAGSFDARLVGDYRLSEGSEVSIQIQSASYPLSVKISNINLAERYVLWEIADGVEIGMHTIVDGTEIVINNQNSSLLKISKQKSLPTSYDLEQNYPNPFNPSTIIKFSLPKQTQLKLNLYNILGELVSTISDGLFEAGYHQVTFNAENLTSGVYIYRLESNEIVQTKKMMYLK